jgi:uncharacterized protein involved in outer membrane biogenesis
VSRRLRALVAAGIVAALAGGVGLWALPEVVRRVALEKIPELTGRAASIEDIDLNLFTGSFAVRKLRLAERARPGSGEPPGPFVEFERLAGRVSWPWLVARDVRLRRLELVAPTVRILRTGPAEFNFSDLLALLGKADPAAPPSRWTYTIDFSRIERGEFLVEDRAVSPPADWSIRSFEVESTAVSTRAGRPPGRATLRGRLGTATIEVTENYLHLAPVIIQATVRLTDFDLTRLHPYLPPDVPAIPEAGTLGFALGIVWKRGAGGVETAYTTGDVSVDRLALTQRGRKAPFATIPRIAVSIRQADLVKREVVLGAVTIEGLDTRVVRQRDGHLDVIAAMGGGHTARAPGGGAGPPSPPGPAAIGGGPPPAPGAPEAAAPGKPWRVRLERFGLGQARVVMTDQTVSPPRDLRLEKLTVDGSALSISPEDPPGKLSLKADFYPGIDRAAALAIDAGAVKVEPIHAEARLGLSGFDLAALPPFLAGAVPAMPARGVLDLDLALRFREDASQATHGEVSGSIGLEEVEVVRGADRKPFLRVPRLLVGIDAADLLTRRLAVGQVEISGLNLRATRDERGEIDLLSLAGDPAGRPGASPAGQERPAAAPRASPGAIARRPLLAALLRAASEPWTFSLGRLSVSRATVALEDRAVTPRQDWKLERLMVTGSGLTTVPKARPGRLQLKTRILASPGPTSPAELSVDVTPLRLAPADLSARVSLRAFDLTTVAPYVPPAVPAMPSRGRLEADLRASIAHDRTALRRAVVSGTARLSDLAVLRRGTAEPFLGAGRLAVAVKQVDAVGRAIDVESIELEGLEARAVRDREGRIDLVQLAGAGVPAPAAAAGQPAPTGATSVPVSPSPPAAAPAPGAGAPSTAAQPWRISLDRFALTRGTATFEDLATEPDTRLVLADLAAAARRITWPSTGPATFELTTAMPGGGRTEVRGTAVLDPLDARFTMTTRDAPIEPYGAYFPFPARFLGFFSGDSSNEIRREPDRLVIASRGTARARDLEVRAPGAAEPVARLRHLELSEIDFAWPEHAFVKRITLGQPAVTVERDRAGAINLRTLFEPRREAATGAAPPGSPGEAPVASKQQSPAAPDGKANGPGRPGLLETMLLRFDEIVLEDGYARFLDRSTTPAFSQDLSRLAVTIRGLSNRPGERPTTLAVQAIVGGDAALDMRGEMSGIGEALRADLVGELRDFALPSANPYTGSAIAWIVNRGKLGARIHYRLEGDRLTGENTILVNNLQVTPARASDEVKNRLGMPLGLIVALLKDTRGDITFDVPLSANLADRTIDWGETIWSAVKQAIVKLLVGPFRAIGRMFRGGGDESGGPAVDPVTFAAGSSVVGADMASHLTRVADFLRRAPYVKLDLVPVVTASDLESLKGQELTARLQKLQRDRRLSGFAAAVATAARERGLATARPGLPSPAPASAPGAPPAPAPEDLLARLRELEPVPEDRVRELLDRRLAAAREALVRDEGIPGDRLEAKPPDVRPDEPGPGRVEFSIAAR